MNLPLLICVRRLLARAVPKDIAARSDQVLGLGNITLRKHCPGSHQSLRIAEKLSKHGPTFVSGDSDVLEEAIESARH